MDVSRLPQRNLGRDDRLISSWGREVRYPFLDLSFVSYLSALSLPDKMDLSLPEGVGDKYLLRQAALACGLSEIAGRQKRAMQFGSRSAKVDTSVLGSTKGQDKLS